MPSKELRVAPDLSLPLEFVTWTCSILAVRRAGKSNTAVVMAEEMYAAELHWIAVDPKGDWWGIQSSGDGKSAGLEVPVFGGEHGNFPLYPDSGAVLADLLVGEGISAVVDVSEFTKGEMLRFLGGTPKQDGFFARIYKRKNRDQPPTHMFLEEVDEYLPQQVTSDTAKTHYDGQKIVTKGGFRGLGATCATQRPARFHNDVLTQTGTLIAMRNTAPTERKQVSLWTDYHAQSKEIVDTVPSLENGEGWVVSPHDLKIVKRVKFRRRKTLDSAATPDVIVKGKRRPPTLAEVNAPAIESALAETIERAKSEDPAEIRKAHKQEVAELKAELKKVRTEVPEAVASPPPEPIVQIEKLEVPILRKQDLDRLERMATSAAEASASFATAVSKLTETISEHEKRQEETNARIDELNARLAKRPTRPTAPARPVSRPAPTPRARREPAEGEEDGEFRFGTAHQRVLNALAWLESVGIAPATRLQVAFVAGWHERTKTYTNALGTMRTNGLLDYPQSGWVEMTEEGRKLADYPAEAVTEEELHQRIFAQVGEPRARILRVLLEDHPNAVTREEIAERLGLHERTKSLTNGLGSLRSLGLISYPQRGWAALTPVMFLES